MKNKIHTSWKVLAGCFLLFFVNYGLVFTTQGFFSPALIDELGISPSQATTILTICSGAVIFSTAISGWISEKCSIRWALTIAGVLMAGSYLIASNTSSINILYLAAILQGFSFGLLVVTTATLIQRWFCTKQGLALGIMYMGTGIGGAIFCPLIAKWLYSVGYSKTYLYMFYIIIVAYIFIFLLLKDSPEKKGLKPYGYVEGVVSEEEYQEVGEWEGYSFKEAVKMPEFYLLFIVSTVMVTILAVIAAQAPYILDVNGISPTIVGYALSIFSLVILVGGPFMGIVNDKFGYKVGNIYLFGIILVGCLSLMFSSPSMMFIVFIFAIFAGMADSGNSVPIPMWVADMFGTKNFEKITTVMATGGTIGNVIVLYLSGLDVERNGNFNLTLTGLAVSAVVCLVLIFITYKMMNKRKAGDKMNNKNKLTQKV